ncbi:hypothetical protein CIT14_07340 [Virgibacillus profundi]|nr:hypothetical protein CIT14_07340 [Virgibacillus profundi]
MGMYFQYAGRVIDVDCERFGIYCRRCAMVDTEKLQSKRFVEYYKDNAIYMKEGNYYPYWECPYHFKNIEDVRARIDDSHAAIVDMENLKFVNSLK